MIEALQFEFMRNALAAGLLASVICGIMGTLVVVNRIVFLSGGIAHAAFGGIGLAFFFGWHYMVGTIGFSLVAAVIMAAITFKAKHRADTIIGVIWAVGMAIGIILLDLTPGYNVDLMSYLFGSILTVPAADLYGMLAMGDKDRAPLATLNYLYMGTIGACFYLLGVGYLYIVTGSLNMVDIARLLPDLYQSKAVLAAFIICMVGVWVKMAFFPLHAWLPNAYTYAPSAASSLIAPFSWASRSRFCGTPRISILRPLSRLPACHSSSSARPALSADVTPERSMRVSLAAP